MRASTGVEEDTAQKQLLAHADEHGPVLAEGLPHDAAGDPRPERAAAGNDSVDHGVNS